MTRFLLILFLTAPLLGCQTQPSPKEGEWIAISSYTVKDSYVWFSTVTNGCSTNESFELHVVSTNRQSVVFGVERIKPDLCKMKPRDKAFRLALPDETEGRLVQLINPVVKPIKTKLRK